MVSFFTLFFVVPLPLSLLQTLTFVAYKSVVGCINGLQNGVGRTEDLRHESIGRTDRSFEHEQQLAK